MMHLLSKIAVNAPSLLAQAEAATPETRELTGTFWLPEGASTLAPGTDFAFMPITWLCYFFFAGIVVALVYFC